MQEFSKEKIEIAGKEYTLFLNRKGILSWENITKASKMVDEVQERNKEIVENFSEDTPIEVSDNDNPFDYANDAELDKLEAEIEQLKEIYVKFYWIALYENHKFSITEARELFLEAENEYGLEQLINLANQMIEDANTNKYGTTEIKKLKALRPAKKKK